jgi:hypothetical protein
MIMIIIPIHSAIALVMTPTKLALLAKGMAIASYKAMRIAIKVLIKKNLQLNLLIIIPVTSALKKEKHQQSR